jgi:hypothetical protein
MRYHVDAGGLLQYFRSEMGRRAASATVLRAIVDRPWTVKQKFSRQSDEAPSAGFDGSVCRLLNDLHLAIEHSEIT